MTHLLRGRYSSVFAPTGTCANPVGSPLLRFFTSFEESLQVATSPCCQLDLPDVMLRIFPQMPEPLPRRSRWVLLPGSSSASSAFPRDKMGRLPASSREHDFPRIHFEAAAIPLCSGLRVCLPPRSFPPLSVFQQGGRDVYVRAERALLPSHASDMLSAWLQATGGTRTFTSLGSQCCRLLLISVNPSLRAWAPVTAVPWSASACFFLHVIGLPPFTIEVGFPLIPVENDFTTDPFFETAAIPLCSGPPVCSPPRSFLPLRLIAAEQPRLLRPSRTCFVASACIGYANHPLRQLVVWGLAPHQIHSLVGCSSEMGIFRQLKMPSSEDSRPYESVRSAGGLGSRSYCTVTLKAVAWLRLPEVAVTVAV